MHNRTFVGCNGVHSLMNAGSQIGKGRLPGVVIDRDGFQHHVRGAGIDKFHRVSRRGIGGERIQWHPAFRQFQGARQADPRRVYGAAVLPGNNPIYLDIQAVL